MTDIISYLTGIPTNVMIFSVIKEIFSSKEDLRYDVASIVIEEFNRIEIFVRVNKNQTKEIL